MFNLTIIGKIFCDSAFVILTEFFNKPLSKLVNCIYVYNQDSFSAIIFEHKVQLIFVQGILCLSNSKVKTDILNDTKKR
jgi:hypothetical protein